jgi:hypothetical protein
MTQTISHRLDQPNQVINAPRLETTVVLVPGQSDQNGEMEFRWPEGTFQHIGEKTLSLTRDIRLNLWYHVLLILSVVMLVLTHDTAKG